MSLTHPFAGVGSRWRDLVLVPCPINPRSSQTALLIPSTADARARPGAGDQGVCPSVLPGMTGAVLFGAVENSCLGLQGLSPSYFHPSHRGRNSSGPGEGEGEKGQLRVNFPFWPSLGGAPQLGSMPHPSQTVLGTWASGDGRGAELGFYLVWQSLAGGARACHW